MEKNEEKTLLKSYREDVAEFLEAAPNYHITTIVSVPHALEIKKQLQIPGMTPGKYFRENSELYRGWIDEELLESFYYAVDNVIYWQHVDRSDRRTLRDLCYANNVGKIANVIADFHDHTGGKNDAKSLMNSNGYIIAAELDRGNKELEDLIEEQIMEAGGQVTYSMIRGIMMSKSTRLYEALGKLLVAAMLQEGLRQAICECMDCGREEAFLYFYKILIDNDMFRFSSVVRAGGTWTGLIDPFDSRTHERVSKKMFELCYEYLTDKDAQKAALAGEDSMQVFIALWSLGCHNAGDSSAAAKELFKSGTPHQRLVAMYYLLSLHFHDGSVIEAVRCHSDELALMAFAVRDIELNACSLICHVVGSTYAYAYMNDDDKKEPIRKGYAAPTELFGDVSGYRELYDLFYGIYKNMPSKKMEFSPCVFPWHSEKLTKSDVLVIMAYLASAMKDTALGDEVLGMLTDIGGNRGRVLELLAAEPSTDIQRKTVLAMVSNADTETRAVALRILETMELSDAEYGVLEDILRLKKADMRNKVIVFLYNKRTGQELQDMLKRLLSAKYEEKRLGGLSIITMLRKDEARKEEFQKALPLLDLITDKTDHEKVLIDEITAGTQAETKIEEKQLLFDPDASYTPSFDEKWIAECKKTFASVFPNSVMAEEKTSSDEYTRLLKPLQELDDLIEKNKHLECINCFGNTCLLENLEALHYRVDDASGATLESGYNHEELWKDFYESKLGSDYSLVLKLYMMMTGKENDDIRDFFDKPMTELFGEEYRQSVTLKHVTVVRLVLRYLEEQYRDKELVKQLAVAISHWLVTDCSHPLSYHYETEDYWTKKTVDEHCSILELLLMKYFMGIYYNPVEDFDRLFPLKYAITEKAELEDSRHNCRGYYGEYVGSGIRTLTIDDYIKAYEAVLISHSFLEKYLWSEKMIKTSVGTVSDYVRSIREKGKSVTGRKRYYISHNIDYYFYYKDNDEKNKRLDEIVNDCYDKIVPVIMEAELTRGDMASEYTKCVPDLHRIYGTEYFVRILAALGKQKLKPADTINMSYKNYTLSRVGSLGHLLEVCIPADGENADTLRAALKGTKISDKRLVEAALFSPEWIDIVGEYLGWEGFTSCCYYFIAHMNEYFDDKRAAIIAKFTPLSSWSLNRGAFDSLWFKDVYATIGEDRFKEIYDAAKYISNGAKHTRARKYADAALGKLEIEEVCKEVEDKRNKDLLMALGAIPSKTPDDLRDRYVFIRKFEKESRKFGAMRRESEQTSSQMAIKNMALANGYNDDMRFILKMESSVSEGLLGFFEPHRIDDVEVFLELDSTGKITNACIKDGKKLKSIPSSLKKNEYVLELTEAKKTLTNQGSRSRYMFENAMEEETPFTIGELRDLAKSPVIKPVVSTLVLKTADSYGFLEELSELKADTEVLIAHPWHLYQSGVWRDYQKKIFDLQIRQPFKQVFRELYVKTEEEMEQLRTQRFAGNQIQPGRTLALLQGRRWVADYEDGLQKVYYKKNIIASIYAMADWFSPADIEAPTLEWVGFYDRKGFGDKKIKEVPDILFSEVMRDVDLVVSVAHAGGVDPEFSHSTIEMRKAIAELTLPLFKLDNVTFTKTHAIVQGSRASYTIHLGSGVIHQEGGPMINVLPVHSQHRGKLFLPFLDDDPKTAEVITKILFFAQDKKIKDPFILDQIR
ncbi:DUF4132 domain-containing protein [Butyrivibrio sp. AE3009]|uniref:DUF4132 domain-containing protein n=1 Tax=Butyrivibrio sp. AE3009 TaxID=1280666 RepID=UPI0003B3CBBC|nr:DUF4132 domain-containing protein [Butyrivibrio sp. AE3009]